MINNWFIRTGILIYVLLTCFHRFLYPIPDSIYIPFAIIGILLILYGFLVNKKREVSK